MAAQIKVYTDAACTQELTSVNGEYSYDFGAPTDGQEVVTTLYAKNIDTVDDAPAVVLEKTSDPRSYWQVSANGTTYYTSQCTLGDFAPGAVKPIYLKCYVPRGATEANDIAVNFRIHNYE